MWRDGGVFLVEWEVGGALANRVGSRFLSSGNILIVEWEYTYLAPLRRGAKRGV